ncbi:RRP15-like protein isoform X2 [Xenia sp. Carnegie-2017]|nr:RRP15-like protein isoform X2 [Xenia sp. Carnegie-2017]
MASSAVQEKLMQYGANNTNIHENKNCSSNDDDTYSGTKDGNYGWADAMARISIKGIPEDKPVVLSKYKKIETERTQKQEEILRQKFITREKHEAREKNHVKPAPSNDEKERNLKRIATKGVAKLFNAVNKHQEDLNVKLKSAPTEAKKVKGKVIIKWQRHHQTEPAVKGMATPQTIRPILSQCEPKGMATPQTIRHILSQCEPKGMATP